LLLERSQDLTLGVLAIEQLTGAVVARQVALSAGPNADAANNVNNTSTALDAAQKDEASKKDALTKATDTQTKQKTVVDTDTKNAAASKAKAKPTQDVIDKLRAAQPDDQKQLTTLTSQATAESAAVKTDEATVSTLTDKLKKLSQTQPIDQAAITKISGQLDSAKKTLEDAQSKLLEANTAVTKKTASNKEAEDKIATAEKDATVVQATKDAESLKEAEATLAKDKDAVTTATAAYESAQKATAAIQANVKSAVNSAQNVADGKGVFSTGTDRDNINQFTVTKIAEATTTIVDKVLNKGHLTDACINLLTAFSTGKVEHPEDARVQKTLDICAAVVTADLSHFGQPEAIDAR
jgi:chromosome segregation ATPase